MTSAACFATLLHYHGSPIVHAIPSLQVRQVLMGLAMALTAISIIYSPWGQRSGAHINPAVTLTYLRLGRIEAWDAAWYIISQFLGAIVGVYFSALLLGEPFTGTEIAYAVTVPGPWGAKWAFLAEMSMSFFLMSIILQVSNRQNMAKYTGLLAGVAIFIFITFEAPVSGMSINPARTVGSGVAAHVFNSWWVYFTAPIIGMLSAAEFYLFLRGPDSILCAKLQHGKNQPCLFKKCKFKEAMKKNM